MKPKMHDTEVANTMDLRHEAAGTVHDALLAAVQSVERDWRQKGKMLKIPIVIDAIADKVLTYKPKAKSKPARKRARRAKKIAQAADV